MKKEFFATTIILALIAGSVVNIFHIKALAKDITVQVTTAQTCCAVITTAPNRLCGTGLTSGFPMRAIPTFSSVIQRSTAPPTRFTKPFPPSVSRTEKAR